jgi:AbrB family looped-hinge helix DNA binding protein
MEEDEKTSTSKTRRSSSIGDTLTVFTPEVQMDMIRKIFSLQMDAMSNFTNMLQIFTRSNAVFKTTVQSNGRISIPEAERKALGIDEGDLVQVIIIPLERSSIKREGQG